MTTPGMTRLRRVERAARWIAAVGLAAAAALAFAWPHDLGLAYRFAMFSSLAPALGSLIFVLVRRTTGGEWGEALQPYLYAGVALLPWIWLIAAAALAVGPHPVERWPAYGSQPMVALRSGFAAVIFFFLSRVTRRQEWPWVGPVGLIVLLFTLHVVADDWIAALGPHWHSTAFPLVWMLGQAVAGLAAALVAAIAGGAQPGRSAAGERAIGLDWGNLLFATMLLWCYVTFAQFLIVWSGNLPREIAWFEVRMANGWLAVAVGLAIFQFAVPFVLLLSRRVKQHAASLAGVAALLLLGQIVAEAWLILPAAGPLTPAWLGLALALVIGVGSVVVNRYLALARRMGNVDA